VGYRWFDRQKIEPLFPFGFGLSYTTFAYSGIKATPASDGGVDVAVTIKNTGAAAGDEVAQVYLDKPARASAGVQFADDILAGFARIHLAPGESQQLTIQIPQRQFQYWPTAQNQWLTAAGKRTLWVGGSSRNHRLESEVEVK